MQQSYHQETLTGILTQWKGQGTELFWLTYRQHYEYTGVQPVKATSQHSWLTQGKLTRNPGHWLLVQTSYGTANAHACVGIGTIPMYTHNYIKTIGIQLIT